jgi:hypothetical protein
VYSIALHQLLSADASQIVLACGGHFGLMLCKIARERREEGSEVGSWRATGHWQEQVRYANQIVGAKNLRPPDVLCVRFSSQPTSLDNLYVSDSAGHVMMFQVRFDALDARPGGSGLKASFVRLYTVTELNGVPIYAIDVVTSQYMRAKGLSHVRQQTVDDWLLLYSKDHIIRLVTLQRGMAAGMQVESEFTGHESGNFPVRGAMSPDGAYVACGSESGELYMWSVKDGKLVPNTSAPQVQLAGPVMETIWSEHHHLLACCAMDEGAPPVLVFVGGDPDRPPPPAESKPKPSFAPELAPYDPPPRLPVDPVARDLREEFALVPQGVAPPVGEWAHNWINTDYNPQSLVSLDEKQRLKQKILQQLLDRKGAIELEKHFAEHHGVPGGIV